MRLKLGPKCWEFEENDYVSYGSEDELDKIVNIELEFDKKLDNR